MPPLLPALLDGPKAALALHSWSKADLPTAPVRWKSYCSSFLHIFQVFPQCPERCRHWIRNPVDISNSSAFTSGMACLQAQWSWAPASRLHPGSQHLAVLLLVRHATNCITIWKQLLLSLEDLHVVFCCSRGNRFSLTPRQNGYQTPHLSSRDFNALKFKIVNVLSDS